MIRLWIVSVDKRRPMSTLDTLVFILSMSLPVITIVTLDTLILILLCVCVLPLFFSDCFCRYVLITSYGEPRPDASRARSLAYFVTALVITVFLFIFFNDCKGYVII